MSSDGFISERYWEYKVSLPHFSDSSIHRLNNLRFLSPMLICANPTLSVMHHSHLVKEAGSLICSEDTGSSVCPIFAHLGIHRILY